MRIRVVIADDQPLMRAGFKTVLEATGTIEVVGEAGDGEEAMRVADALEPDVVLMDIQMPRLDGIEATRRHAAPQGAHPHHLRARRLHRRRAARRAPAASCSRMRGRRSWSARCARWRPVTRCSPRRSRGACSTRSPTGCRQPCRRRPAGLTEREHEVWRLLAGGLSNAEIATALTVSEATVKTHVSNLLGKLGLRDRVQAVILAYESGLVTVRDR